MKDQLFMLKPGFFDADHNGPYYCGDSVAVEGLLGFYPALRADIEVHYIDFPRPRKALVDLLGDAHQSIPVLVLGDGDSTADRIAGGASVEVKSVAGQRFINDPDVIRRYLSARYGLASPK